MNESLDLAYLDLFDDFRISRTLLTPYETVGTFKIYLVIFARSERINWCETSFLNIYPNGEYFEEWV